MPRLFHIVAISTLAVAPWLSGCDNGARQERITMLEDLNASLEQRLEQAQRGTESITAERDRLGSRHDQLAAERDRTADELASARQIIAELEQRLASMPKPLDVAQGWTAVGGGAMIAIETGLFQTGAVVLGDEARRTLDAIAGTIKRDYTDKDIFVFGHTDNQPIRKSGWEDNYELSAQRALAVVRYLSGRGIDPARLIAAGCGEHRPRVPNDSQSNRYANRRVEIFAIDLNLPSGE